MGILSFFKRKKKKRHNERTCLLGFFVVGINKKVVFMISWLLKIAAANTYEGLLICSVFISEFHILLFNYQIIPIWPMLLSAPFYKGKGTGRSNSLCILAPYASLGFGTDSQIYPLKRFQNILLKTSEKVIQDKSCQNNHRAEESDSVFTDQNTKNIPWKEKERPRKEKFYRICAKLVLQKKNSSLSWEHRFKEWNSEKQRQNRTLRLGCLNSEPRLPFCSLAMVWPSETSSISFTFLSWEIEPIESLHHRVAVRIKLMNTCNMQNKALVHMEQSTNLWLLLLWWLKIW